MARLRLVYSDESGPLEVEDVLGGGGDDETLSHRLRYRGRRMGDWVRGEGVGGVFGRGGDQYEMCSLDRGACAYCFRFIRSKGRL